MIRWLLRLFHRHDWVRCDDYTWACARCGGSLNIPRPRA